MHCCSGESVEYCFTIFLSSTYSKSVPGYICPMKLLSSLEIELAIKVQMLNEAVYVSLWWWCIGKHYFYQSHFMHNYWLYNLGNSLKLRGRNHCRLPDVIFKHFISNIFFSIKTKIHSQTVYINNSFFLEF